MKNPTLTPMEQVMRGLNPDEQQEFMDVLNYLSERLEFNGGQLPEGNVGALLNSLSPNVRQRFAAMSNVMETPRTRPFERKYSEAERADQFDLEPEDALTVKAALDGLEVSGRLQQRMGVDQPSNAPPTRRESIAAALEASNFPE